MGSRQLGLSHLASRVSSLQKIDPRSWTTRESQGFEFRGLGFRFMVSGFEFMVSGVVGCRVSDFGCRVKGIGFWSCLGLELELAVLTLTWAP